NAIAYPADRANGSTNAPRRVIRFEGLNHIQITPTSPPGCLTFGWMRNMPWPSDPSLDIRDPNGFAFAESIHLVDYQISDKNGLINTWSPVPDVFSINPDQNWKRSVCSGDVVTPLSPTQDIGGGENAPSHFHNIRKDGVAATYLSASRALL